MEEIVTGKQMKELDAYTIETMGVPSLVLMERAGLQVFESMKKRGFPFQKCWCCAVPEITGRTVWSLPGFCFWQDIRYMSVFWEIRNILQKK